jgi:hypothetical protein
MTHTLHRVGNFDSLKNDFVIYGLSAQDAELKDKNIQRDTAESHMKFMEICFKNNPVNAGCIYPTNNPYSKTLAKANDWNEMRPEIIPFTETLAVFDDIEKVKNVLTELKETELGISVVVSGIFEEVFKISEEIGIVPHTINLALGILGPEEFLPEPKVLEIVTMCGHGLVSRYLVNDLVEKIIENTITSKEASVILGAQCVCGAFNTKRAAKILDELTHSETET